MGHAKLTDDRSASWPSFLKRLKVTGDINLADKPIIIRMDGKDSAVRLEDLVKTNPVSDVIDNYDEQFAELQLSLHAHLYRANEEVQRNSIKESLSEHYGGREPWRLGSWVYYPWRQQLVHVLVENDFVSLRTIRNRDLITTEEQSKLYEYPVMCVGMSVGSASALSLGISGISRRMKLADGAVISGSNLNRIMTGVNSVGLEKNLVIARQLYEMNPYITVQREAKVSKDNIGDFFDKPWAVSAVIDEIDDLEIKIRLRLEAKKRGLPVIMATELADSVMLDVERFDLESGRPLFHGLVPGIEKLLDKTDMNHREWMKYAAKIIGTSNMPIDMQQSLMKIGSSIVTHPQLGSTVMMTGGITTYAIKQIALAKPLPSGRTNIQLDKILVPQYRKVSHRWRHKRHTSVINKALDSM